MKIIEVKFSEIFKEVSKKWYITLITVIIFILLGYISFYAYTRYYVHSLKINSEVIVFKSEDDISLYDKVNDLKDHILFVSKIVTELESNPIINLSDSISLDCIDDVTKSINDLELLMIELNYTDLEVNDVIEYLEKEIEILNHDLEYSYELKEFLSELSYLGDSIAHTSSYDTYLGTVLKIPSIKMNIEDNKELIQYYNSVEFDENKELIINKFNVLSSEYIKVLNYYNEKLSKISNDNYLIISFDEENDENVVNIQYTFSESSLFEDKQIILLFFTITGIFTGLFISLTFSKIKNK